MDPAEPSTPTSGFFLHNGTGLRVLPRGWAARKPRRGRRGFPPRCFETNGMPECPKEWNSTILLTGWCLWALNSVMNGISQLGNILTRSNQGYCPVALRVTILTRCHIKLSKPQNHERIVLPFSGKPMVWEHCALISESSPKAMGHRPISRPFLPKHTNIHTYSRDVWG